MIEPRLDLDISGLSIWESGGRCSEAWNGRTTIRPSVMKFVILLLAIKESYFRNQQKRPGFGQIPAQFEKKCSKIASFRHVTDCAASPPKTNEGHTRRSTLGASFSRYSDTGSSWRKSPWARSMADPRLSFRKSGLRLLPSFTLSFSLHVLWCINANFPDKGLRLRKF